MECLERQRLREEWGNAADAWALFQQSLEGVLKSMAHFKELERLEAESKKAARRYTDHVAAHQCVD
jgi:hypothetical protein